MKYNNNIIKIVFDDIQFHTGGFDEFAEFILQQIVEKKKLIIVHINLRNLFFLIKNQKIKESIKKNCLVVFDGIGMKIGFWLRGYGFLPDLNGTDLFPLLMKKFEALKLGIFLLGSEKNIVNKAALNIKSDYPNLKVNGYHDGFFEITENNIAKQINNSNSDILLIGMGFPLQEEVSLKYKDYVNCSLIWNVGGLFDTISGFKPRAPYILRKIRLEWLYRFFKEPIRMLHRNTICAVWSLAYIIFKKDALEI